MPGSRIARLVAPLVLTGGLMWWHAVRSLPLVEPGAYLRESAVVWAYVVAGAVAWARRPDNRIGPLMIGLGVAWAAPYLPAPSALSPVSFSLSVALAALPIALLTHLVLAFPAGVLEGRLERATATAAYLFGGLVPLASVMTCEASSVSTRCNFTPNALTVAPASDLSDVLGHTASIGSALTLVAVLVLVGRRWSRASGPARRALAPVWLSTIVLLATSVDVAGRTWQPLDFTDWGLNAVRVSGSSGLLLLRAAGHVLVPAVFLLGLLRLRLSRVLAAELARRLQHSGAGRDLRAELAQVLGDPDLEVAYWLPGEERYVDAGGRAVVLPSVVSGRRTTALHHDGARLGLLVHDRLLETDLVEDVTAVAGLAMDHERLAAEVRSQVIELRRAQSRIVEAGDAARQRLERDLHDGAQQRLVTFGLALRAAQMRIGAEEPTIRATFDDLVRDLRDALDELRELARGIHPTALTTQGLAPALRGRVHHMGIPVTLEVVPERRYPPAVEATVYFVVLEAVTNAVKHAAASGVAIAVREDDGWLATCVRDDGVGAARIVQGSGLQGLADRVGALGGTFDVESEPGAGTTVIARLPVSSEGDWGPT